jgi:hypothetical protein
MKAKKLARAVQLQELSELRKKNIKEYFVNFTRHHRPWLHELAQKYKERGEFPLMAMVLLPSYYTDTRDKEIAVFAGLLIPVEETIVHTTIENVGELRQMLGDSPWEWFEKRSFVSLSLGKKQHKRIGGVEGWKIARLFDKLWNECRILPFEMPRKNVEVRPIGIQVELIAKALHCSYFDVLTYLLEDCGVGNYFYKLRLLLLVLCTGDGLGLSLWQNGQDTLRCPLTADVRLFLETWFPDYRRYGSVDDAIRLFGFERETDFFYACLGYKELQKRNPSECGLYATRYTTWYVCGIKKKPHQWRKIMPEIEF